MIRIKWLLIAVMISCVEETAIDILWDSGLIMVFSTVTAPNYKYALQATASNCVCAMHATKRLIWLPICWHVCLTGSLKGQLNQKSTGCVILDKVNLLMTWLLFISSFTPLEWPSREGEAVWPDCRSLRHGKLWWDYQTCQNQAGGKVRYFSCQKSPLMPISSFQVKMPSGVLLKKVASPLPVLGY